MSFRVSRVVNTRGQWSATTGIYLRILSGILCPTMQVVTSEVYTQLLNQELLSPSLRSMECYDGYLPQDLVRNTLSNNAGCNQ